MPTTVANTAANGGGSHASHSASNKLHSSSDGSENISNTRKFSSRLPSSSPLSSSSRPTSNKSPLSLVSRQQHHQQQQQLLSPSLLHQHQLKSPSSSSSSSSSSSPHRPTKQQKRSHREDKVLITITNTNNGNISCIFVPDINQYTAQSALAFFSSDSKYTIVVDPYNEGDLSNGKNIVDIDSLPQDIIERGSIILVNRTLSSQPSNASAVRNNALLDDALDDIRIEKTLEQMEKDGQEPVSLTRLSDLQRADGIECLDTFIERCGALYNPNEDHQIVTYVHQSNELMNGVTEKISIDRLVRIVSLAFTLRKNLQIGKDAISINGLKYQLESVYKQLTGKRSAIILDLEKLCTFINVVSVEIGCTTIALRSAFGPIILVRTNTIVDYNITNNATVGVPIDDWFRRCLDEVEVEDQLRKVDGVIKIILLTEDETIFNSLRRVYKEFDMLVCCTKGFSDRNLQAFVVYWKEKFPDAVITSVVDMDIFGLRQIQANNFTESLTQKHHKPTFRRTYSFQSKWFGVLPSYIQSLESSSYTYTSMDEQTLAQLTTFIEGSAFLAWGDIDRRKKELELMKNRAIIVKMEQVFPGEETFIEYIIDQLKNGQYGI